IAFYILFFFSSRRRHTRSKRDWSSDVCSSDLLKISDPAFVRQYNIPFEYQKKERLVYCDLIEHSILHVLIAKETSSKFGYFGLIAYLMPTIDFWYLREMIP